MGRKKLPIWSIVAADERSPRDGRLIEDLGRYYPLDDPARVEINDEQRVLYWLETGAQPSDTVRSLLSREGLMLALHLRRKGVSEEEVQAAVEKFREERAARVPSTILTPSERRRRALDEERERVAEEEKEQARLRQEEEEKRRVEEERSKKEAAEARQEAADAARKEQEAANLESEKADAEPASETPVAPEDGPDEVPADEPAPAKEAGDVSATEEVLNSEEGASDADDQEKGE